MCLAWSGSSLTSHCVWPQVHLPWYVVMMAATMEAEVVINVWC